MCCERLIFNIKLNSKWPCSCSSHWFSSKIYKSFWWRKLDQCLPSFPVLYYLLLLPQLRIYPTNTLSQLFTLTVHCLYCLSFFLLVVFSSCKLISLSTFFCFDTKMPSLFSTVFALYSLFLQTFYHVKNLFIFSKILLDFSMTAPFLTVACWILPVYIISHFQVFLPGIFHLFTSSPSEFNNSFFSALCWLAYSHMFPQQCLLFYFLFHSTLYLVPQCHKSVVAFAQLLFLHTHLIYFYN